MLIFLSTQIIILIILFMILCFLWLRAVSDKVNELVEKVNEISEYLDHNRRR